MISFEQFLHDAFPVQPCGLRQTGAKHAWDYLAPKLEKLQQDYEALRAIFKITGADLVKAESELNRLTRENHQLRGKIAELNDLLTGYVGDKL